MFLVLKILIAKTNVQKKKVFYKLFRMESYLLMQNKQMLLVSKFKHLNIISFFL